MSRKSQ